jgi:hypothetical protein
LAVAISRLAHANPFLPERIECERLVLGGEFTPGDPVWTARPDREVQNPNVTRIGERATDLAERLRARLTADTIAADADKLLYEDVVLYVLYTRYENDLLDLVSKAGGPDGNRRLPFFEPRPRSAHGEEPGRRGAPAIAPRRRLARRAGLISGSRRAARAPAPAARRRSPASGRSASRTRPRCATRSGGTDAAWPARPCG